MERVVVANPAKGREGQGPTPVVSHVLGVDDIDRHEGRTRGTREMG